MNPHALMIECQYRNRNKVWLQLAHIESIAEAKNGSVVRTVSGVSHDLLDSVEDFDNKFAAAITMARNANQGASRGPA